MENQLLKCSWFFLFMLESVKDILNKAINLDEVKAWYFAIDIDMQNNIIKLNTIDQLFNDGIDSLGDSLGEYSISTIEGTSSYLGKKAKGQPTDRITLKDTGDFYKTFKVEVKDDSFFINANPIKDDSNLFDDFGSEIVGLTEDNQKKISKTILDNTIKYIRKQLAI